MTITRIQKEPEIKFPPAALYIDDIEEIIQTFRPDGDFSKLEFLVNDKKCDSIDDLRSIGGRTSSFTLQVHGNNYERDVLIIEPGSSVFTDISGGNIQRKTWVLHQLHEIFKKRRNRLKQIRLPIVVVIGVALLFSRDVDSSSFPPKILLVRID